MAFSKTPVQSTYTTKMVSLLRSEYSRGLTPATDEDFLNVYLELNQDKTIGEKDYYVVKRPGSALYKTNAGTVIRGMYYNSDFRYLYYVIDSTLYVHNVVTNLNVSVNVAFFGTTTGDVGFTDYLYDNGAQVVIVSDGTSLKQITSAGVITTSTSPDLPVPHQPSPVFLDGYLFLLRTNSSAIVNSNLNDPLVFTAGDEILAEITPDVAKHLIKLNNYLVVYGSDAIEYFWDAGNTSASPLQRNDTPVKFNGYLGASAQWGNKAFFVGNNAQGQPSVFMLEDLKMEEIASPTVIRYLANIGQSYSGYKGSIVGADGHVFYVLNTGALTYVYDLETKQWFRWAFQQNTNFPMGACVNTKTASSYASFFYLTTGTTIYYCTPQASSDNLVDYTCQGVTENQYFDTYNQKNMSMVIVWADMPTTSANLLLSWTDDDYKTYSSVRTIELNQERPSTDRLGRFRRRAFKWSFTSNLPMRFKGFEVRINMGDK